jgi:hypothetical protein
MVASLDSPLQVIHRRFDTIECWDDDPDFGDLDRIQHQSNSTFPTSSRAGTDYNHREPISSRIPIQPIHDFDPSEIADREHQISYDDASPAAAIKSAQSAGIPIPENVPPSALIGGTIKRLGPSKRAGKVTMHDDWGEDLELPPTLGDAFVVKKKKFPESLHHLSENSRVRSPSPTRLNFAPVTFGSSRLDKFRDSSDEDLNFLGEVEELPALKIFPLGRRIEERKPNGLMLLSPPLSESATKAPLAMDDDFENDFELPADANFELGVRNAERLKLSSSHGLDSGFEDWGDADSGLGSSFGGTRLGHGDDRRGLISPSMSAMTMESEDDTPLDGLILPDGYLPDVHKVLEKRRQAAEASPTDTEFSFHAQKDLDDTANEEFFDGIEIGDGEIFDNQRLTLNRNVKQKQQARKPSPVRRTPIMSVTFTTNKQGPPQPTAHQYSSGRINRLTQGHPALTPSHPVLEPVAERENQPPPKHVSRHRWSGGTVIADNRPSERTGQVSHPPPVHQTRTDRQRNTKSTRNLRTENVPPTTHVQLLRSKRSMPNMVKSNQTQQKGTRPRSGTSNGRPSSRGSAGRPPSSSNSATRPTSSGSRPPSSGGRPVSRTSSGRPPSRNEPSSLRPKTPHNSLKSYKHPAPFLPGGASVKNSHHVAAKASKPSTGICIDRRSTSRLQHRTTPRHSPSSSGTSNATKKGTPSVAPEHLRREAASIGTMTQPTRKRNFGDGTELETFDDLPTSAKIEDRFTVTPVARGAPKNVRPKSLLLPRERDESPKKRHDSTPRQDDVPRFARDTNGKYILPTRLRKLYFLTFSNQRQEKPVNLLSRGLEWHHPLRQMQIVGDRRLRHGISQLLARARTRS